MATIPNWKNRNMVHAKTIILLVFCWFSTSLVGQYHTHPIDKNIRTLRVRFADAQTHEIQPKLERPILDLQQLDKNILEISFDELSHQPKNYSYTLVHLNADWKPSNLHSADYLSGFTEQDITDYVYSFNTVQLYTHYSFFFPNDDMQPLVSGNYVLKILDRDNHSQEVAHVCFSVVDTRAKINAEITPKTDIEYNRRFQQLEIEVMPFENNQRFSGNLNNDYFIVVQQNNRLDNICYAPKTVHIEANKLKYTHCKELIFEGGYEYRHFDIFSTYLNGTNVRDVQFLEHRNYHAFLEPDLFLAYPDYQFKYDANGQYVVNAERVREIDSEAEYMWVHFIVPTERPFLNGKVYIGGDIFHNQLDTSNQMYYDTKLEAYCFSAFVKQGGYDYQYWFVPNQPTLENPAKSSLFYPYPATLQRTEGSFWQTNNEYTIYVFYRPIGALYDQLVGVEVVK